MSDLWVSCGLPGSNSYQTVFMAATGTLFATTDTGYVLRSTDHGDTWVTLSAGATGLFSYRRNGCGDAHGNVAIFRYGFVDISTDNGDTWTPRATPSGYGIDSAAFGNGKLWYQDNGFPKVSSDLGNTWEDVTAPHAGGGGVAYVGPNGWVFISDAYSVQISKDGGASWRAAFDTPDAYDGVSYIDINTVGYGCAHSAGDGRVFITRDFGDTWSVFSPGIGGISGSGVSADGRFFYGAFIGWFTRPTVYAATVIGPVAAQSFPSTPAQEETPSDATSFESLYHSSILSDAFGNVFATMRYSGSPALFRLSVKQDAPSVYPPSGTYQGVQLVSLKSPQSLPIHYTLDGSEPTISSPLYTGPIPVYQDTQIKATAFYGNIPSDTVTSSYTITNGILPKIQSYRDRVLPYLLEQYKGDNP